MEKLPWHCCCHFKHGCQDVFDTKGLEDHQKCCIYREIICFFDHCKKIVLFKDFFDHFETCHKDSKTATKSDEKTFIVSFDSSEEATIRFEVLNFTQISKPIYSKAALLQDIPWKIEIFPKEVNKVKYVSYYLLCDFESDTIKDWSCQAKAELRLINHKDPNKTMKHEIRHLFTSKADTWGFQKYLLLTNVMDIEKGFIRDNTVTFEVKLIADLPTAPTGNDVLLN